MPCFTWWRCGPLFAQDIVECCHKHKRRLSSLLSCLCAAPTEMSYQVMSWQTELPAIFTSSTCIGMSGTMLETLTVHRSVCIGLYLPVPPLCCFCSSFSCSAKYGELHLPWLHLVVHYLQHMLPTQMHVADHAGPARCWQHMIVRDHSSI